MANNTTMEMEGTAAVVEVMNEENKLNLREAENVTKKAVDAANAAEKVFVIPLYCFFDSFKNSSRLKS